MLWRKAKFGLGLGCAALAAAFATSPGKAGADDARLTVAPAVYRVPESRARTSGATIQLVRHRGYYGGRRGGGWGGGYRGYGYAGFYRPYYARPFYRGYYGVAPRYGYGYASPGYGYECYGGGYGW